MNDVKITYIGGPTAVIEVDEFRLLTDPTFDAAGGEYPNGTTLYKTMGPAVSAESIGEIDAVLLSHDHHFDNLDRSGRAFLPKAGCVLTTVDGAKRLGGNAIGLAHWQVFETTKNGRHLKVTATPARHGPAGGDRGPCVGFVFTLENSEAAVYFSGDTVWYEPVAEVGEQFDVRVAVLNLGAAKVAAAGPHHLTMTADEAVLFAEAFPKAAIVPLHFEGWKHFSESRADIEFAFRKAGISDRLRWLQAGKPVAIGEQVASR